jgi:hypothetical protein
VTGWSSVALAYFADHAIDPAIAADLGVTEQAGAIVFPTLDPEGKPAPRRRFLRGDGPKVLGPKDVDLAAWWPTGPSGGRVLVGESESDTLAAISVLRSVDDRDAAAASLAALDGVVSAPSTGFPVERLRDALLKAGVSEAILAFDADDAGRRYTQRVAEALTTAGISAASLVLPDGEDLASVLAATNDRVGRFADLLVGVGGDVVAELPDAGSRTERLAWRWADELTASAPPEPAWVLGDYLAAGTKVIFAGLPKAGKTTLVAALIEAVASGAPSFLSRSIKGGPVLLASEEGDGTLAPKLAGLPAGRVRVLTRDVIWPKPSWSELIADATREAVAIGAVLLAIDSVAFWAALEPEREKDPGATQAIMDALDEATRAGLAVLLVHHQRKAPGEHGAAVRGSGALAGAVDVVIEYERLGEDAPRSQRRLVALSRWPQTPDVLVIDYDRHVGTWRVVGEADGRAGSDLLGIRERLLSTVPTKPPGAGELELVELVGVDKRKLSGPLRELVDEGQIERDGAGKKGDPYTYAKAAPKAAPAEGTFGLRDAAPPLKGGSIESDSAPDAAPEGQKAPQSEGGASGCPSHPHGPIAGCRYCRQQTSEEAAA